MALSHTTPSDAWVVLANVPGSAVFQHSLTKTKKTDLLLQQTLARIPESRDLPFVAQGKTAGINCMAALLAATGEKADIGGNGGQCGRCLRAGQFLPGCIVPFTPEFLKASGYFCANCLYHTSSSRCRYGQTPIYRSRFVFRTGQFVRTPHSLQSSRLATLRRWRET